MLGAEGLLVITVDGAHADDVLQRGSDLGPLGRQVAAVAAPGRVELQQPHKALARTARKAACTQQVMGLGFRG